jgi:preprotein translocase subunit YajC
MLGFGMTPTGASGGGSGDIMGFLLPLILIFGIFYFMLILPQKKKDKNFKLLMESLKRGDKVMTIGGIIGKITAIKEGTLKIQVAPKVEVEIRKSAVASVVSRSSDNPKDNKNEKETEKANKKDETEKAIENSETPFKEDK